MTVPRMVTSTGREEAAADHKSEAKDMSAHDMGESKTLENKSDLCFLPPLVTVLVVVLVLVVNAIELVVFLSVGTSSKAVVLVLLEGVVVPVILVTGVVVIVVILVVIVEKLMRRFLEKDCFFEMPSRQTITKVVVLATTKQTIDARVGLDFV